MSILQKLPFSQCEPGPEQIDGIGNYYIQILGHAPAKDLLSTLYFLDSHGGIENHDYDFIKPDQIQWFKDVSETQRSAIKNDDKDKYMSMAFIHIPVPEFGDDSTLKIHSGCRREPTEGASVNSHFYDACLEEGISAICCGHDHANDFCAQRDKDLWLCYSGSCGWGGYGSYGNKHFHRRARVFLIDTKTGSLQTWMRVEYGTGRVGELVLVGGRSVIDNPG